MCIAVCTGIGGKIDNLKGRVVTSDWSGYSYRPQRSCGQGNIFTPVCHSVHRGWWWYPEGTEADPTPPQIRHTPRTRHTTPPDHTPPDQAHPPRPNPSALGPGTPPSPDQAHHPPPTRHTNPPDQIHHPPGPDTPREADSGIRSTSGRYASYWNAFLFYNGCL